MTIVTNENFCKFYSHSPEYMSRYKTYHTMYAWNVCVTHVYACMHIRMCIMCMYDTYVYIFCFMVVVNTCMNTVVLCQYHYSNKTFIKFSHMINASKVTCV